MDPARLAVPTIYTITLFLGYPSQYLLHYLEPGPLTRRETIILNVFVVCSLISYTRTVFTDPGRIPRDWVERYGLGGENGEGKEPENGEQVKEQTGLGRRWCRRCEAPKPPRAHHCKTCKRCIPKMDHHCPWTQSCISALTFPHFLRFLLHTVLGLLYLSLLLHPRIRHLWRTRNQPYYLGPSALQLAHLFATMLIGGFILFVTSVLLGRYVWCLALNQSTIEGWEIERHAAVVRRARARGGMLEDREGRPVRVKWVEFPYDVGVWRNVVLGMGSANLLNWVNPLSPTPPLPPSLSSPTNGFQDPDDIWPPPDPERSHRAFPLSTNAQAFVFQDEGLSGRESVLAMRRRQEEDELRRRGLGGMRREVEMENEHEGRVVDGEWGTEEEEEEDEQVMEDGGAKVWRNAEGETLRDFGVDSDAEIDDDEVPLAELIARRRARKAT